MTRAEPTRSELLALQLAHAHRLTERLLASDSAVERLELGLELTCTLAAIRALAKPMPDGLEVWNE